jgi:hypothetical protein
MEEEGCFVIRGEGALVGGFNTNVKYQGRTFHVQTEDSGPSRRNIMTLVYEGGSILASRKQKYEAGQAGTDAVRTRMEEQHRDVVVDLKEGALDADLGLAVPTPLEPPAVIADAEPREASPLPLRLETFGEGVISERPLAEIVLEHLESL